jgi:hypothetical protein
VRYPTNNAETKRIARGFMASFLHDARTAARGAANLRVEPNPIVHEAGGGSPSPVLSRSTSDPVANRVLHLRRGGLGLTDSPPSPSEHRNAGRAGDGVSLLCGNAAGLQSSKGSMSPAASPRSFDAERPRRSFLSRPFRAIRARYSGKLAPLHRWSP